MSALRAASRRSRVFCKEALGLDASNGYWRFVGGVGAVVLDAMASCAMRDLELNTVQMMRTAATMRYARTRKHLIKDTMRSFYHNFGVLEKAYQRSNVKIIRKRRLERLTPSAAYQQYSNSGSNP